MDNRTCYDEKVTTCQTNRSSGLLIAVVLYILLVIILGSFRTC